MFSNSRANSRWDKHPALLWRLRAECCRYHCPGLSSTRISGINSETTIKLSALRISNRKCIRRLGDAIPEVFDQFDAFGEAELADVNRHMPSQ